MYSLTQPLLICALFLIVTIAGPFFLPRKFRFIKYLCWTIAGFLILFVGVITPLNIYHDKQESKHWVGIHQLDISNSNYHHLDLSKFKTLTLTMNEDYAFSVNENVPFLVSRNGTWLYWIDGDEEIIRFKFKNAKYAYSVSGIDPVIVLESNILKDGKPGDKIAFKPK